MSVVNITSGKHEDQQEMGGIGEAANTQHCWSHKGMLPACRPFLFTPPSSLWNE